MKKIAMPNGISARESMDINCKKMLVVPENFCHFFNQAHSAKVEGKPSNPLISLASFARFVVPLCLALYLVISNQDFMPMWFFHYANHVVYSIHSGPSEGLKIWEEEGQQVCIRYTPYFFL